MIGVNVDQSCYILVWLHYGYGDPFDLALDYDLVY